MVRFCRRSLGCGPRRSRPAASILVAALVTVGAAALTGHLRELAGIGLDHVLITPNRAWDEATLEAVAAIVPEVQAIRPAA